MKITILGSGSSGGVPLIGGHWGECDPSNKKNIRTRVSILVSKNNKNILIDTSPELRIQSLENNIKNIDAVCWTHAHADHANGIDDLRAFLWTKKNRLPVFATKDTLNALKKRFDYIFDEKNSYFQPPLDINVLEKPGKFKICGFYGYFFNQLHGQEITLGYRFDNFAYSTDVKSFPKSSEKYLYDLDLWIVDCVRFEPHYSHSHFDQTIEWIQKFKPKRALLTHLGAWLDYDKLLKVCPKNVEPAFDGCVIKLT